MFLPESYPDLQKYESEELLFLLNTMQNSNFSHLSPVSALLFPNPFLRFPVDSISCYTMSDNPVSLLTHCLIYLFHLPARTLQMPVPVYFQSWKPLSLLLTIITFSFLIFVSLFFSFLTFAFTSCRFHYYHFFL